MHWDIGPTPLSLEGGGQTGGYGCSFVNFFSSEKPSSIYRMDICWRLPIFNIRCEAKINLTAEKNKLLIVAKSGVNVLINNMNVCTLLPVGNVVIRVN
jgi:hypothetical protein